MEFTTVEATDDILAVGGVKHPLAFLFLPIESQLEEIGTFEKTVDPALKLPGFQVLRRVEGDLAFAFEFVIHRHHPRLRRFMPDEFRIAPSVLHDRISFEFGPRPAAVVAEDDA